MNKWITISIISVLAVGAIVLGVFYFLETDKLKEARADIVGLKGNVSTLEGDLAAAQAEVTRLDGELTAAQAEVTRLDGELTAAQAEVTRLDGELTAAQAQVSTLQADLAAAQAQVSTLQATLATAEAQVSTLQTDLTAAEAQVSTLQTDLTAAESQVSTLSEELGIVKDPRHFNSLTELRNWLEQDNTDTAYADESIYNYIYILQVRALRDGYLLPAHLEDFDFDYVFDVAGNLAHIGDGIYIVWPFEDTYDLWFFAIDIPSHPLPLD
jgi:predicted  nucleic acid-binding Zn-ribbon protein